MTPWALRQFDFWVSAATCFRSTFTCLIRPATRGSFADDVPCAIGTTIATTPNPSKSHGISARLIFPSFDRSHWNGSAPAQPSDVVREADEVQHQDERDPNDRDALVHLPADSPPADALDEREGDVPTVERQQREQIEEREREAQEDEQPEVRLEAGVQGLRRALDDPDRRRDLLPLLAVDELRQERRGLLRRLPRHLQRLPQRSRRREARGL